MMLVAFRLVLIGEESVGIQAVSVFGSGSDVFVRGAQHLCLVRAPWRGHRSSQRAPRRVGMRVEAGNVRSRGQKPTMSLPPLLCTVQCPESSPPRVVESRVFKN